MKFYRANIILTHRCNLNCKHCYMNASFAYKEEFEKIFIRAKDVLKTLKDNGAREILLTGGECTTFPYITELVKYAKEIGINKVDIFTNGMILNKELFDIVDACHLSLDGLEESHNHIRGDNKSYKNLFSTLDYLRAIDKMTYLQYTVNNKNIDDLCEVSKILKDYLNVRKVKIVNQSNDGRALYSELKPVDLLDVHKIIPKLYENTNYHIQFLTDLWPMYDIKNYYLNSSVALPVWFDLIDDIYYIYDKDYYKNKIDNFDLTILGKQLDMANTKICDYFSKNTNNTYLDVESSLSKLLKKED